MKLKQLGINILVSLISILVFFVLMEAVLRIASFIRTRNSPACVDSVIWENEFKFYEYSPVLGWKNKAGAEGIFHTPDATTRVSINSKGQRDIEHEYKKDGRFRILVLGDSFVWGYGVEQDSRFTEHLRELLGDGTEIINAGVSGYGTDQELLYYKAEGSRYSPDLVILAFGTFDAKHDNVQAVAYTYPKPYFSIEEKSLQLHNVPVPERAYEWNERLDIEKRYREEARKNISRSKRIRKFLRRHFKTYGFISDGIKAVRSSVRDRLKSDPRLLDYILKKKSSKKKDALLVLTEEIIMELDRQVESDNAKFIVLMVPYRSHLKKLPDTIYYKMLKFCDERGIFCIDPYSRFFENYKNGKELYFKHDEHWNETGHRLIAEEIYDYLSRNGLIQ